MSVKPYHNAIIRFATRDDINNMLAIIQESFPLACPPETKPITIENFIVEKLNKDILKQFMQSADDYMFVAEVDGQFAGLGLVEKLEDSENGKKQAEFSKLYVKPEFHGHGVGRKLAHAMISQAKQAQIEQLVLYVYSQNHIAKGLYQKLGFCYQQDVKFHIGDEIHDDELYLLSL